MIILLVFIACIWRWLAWWFWSSTWIIEKWNEKLLEQVRELRQVDKQKCIDLILNDKI